MQIHLDPTNHVSVTLGETETVYFTMRYLRTRGFGYGLTPPLPLNCPIGRLYHGCYWLAFQHGAREGRTVDFTGPSPINRFEAITLKDGEEAVVDLEHLVGFVVDHALPRKGKVLHPYLRGILTPACWLIGHPIPAVFTGPVTVLVYGTALRWERRAGPKEFIPSQVVSFSTRSRFATLPLLPAMNWVSQLYNTLTFRSRLRFEDDAPVLVEDVNPPEPAGSKALLHLLAHLLIIAAIVTLLARFR